MFNSATLKFTDSTDVVLPAKGVTIFVGPNNSGKSLVLRELESAIAGDPPASPKIVGSVDVPYPSREEIDALIARLSKQGPENLAAGEIFVGRFSPAGKAETTSYPRQHLYTFAEAKQNISWISKHLFKFLMIRLDGRTRFDLTEDQNAGDLIGPPASLFSQMFSDDSLRAKARKLIFDGIGKYFVIDPLKSGKMRVRLSEVEPGEDEQSLGLAARNFHGQAVYIKDASDGMQAYVGIMLAVISSDYQIVIIDEPEAFLHPPLARKMGAQLAVIATERGGTLMAATHSADFLMGCVQSSAEIRVVRLEYSNGHSKGRVIDTAVLRALFRSPLMRSANVVSGLFHDGVVVTESDNDRAFYQEIYRRMEDEGERLPSLLFVNAQNKQTIRDIIGPMRNLGVPAAAVVDIDVVKDGGKTWAGWLSAAQVPSSLRSAYAAQRDQIKKTFEVTEKDMKEIGIGGLDTDGLAGASEFFDSLDAYGIFVVRGGELEHWLPEIGATGKKTDWTVDMLDKLGSDPSLPTYVKPSPEDVWAFLRKVADWVADSGRKGTP